MRSLNFSCQFLIAHLVLIQSQLGHAEFGGRCIVLLLQNQGRCASQLTLHLFEQLIRATRLLQNWNNIRLRRGGGVTLSWLLRFGWPPSGTGRNLGSYRRSARELRFPLGHMTRSGLDEHVAHPSSISNTCASLHGLFALTSGQGHT